MTTFYAAPDGENEPTVWHGRVALLRRCDLPAGARGLWPEIVDRLTGSCPTTYCAPRDDVPGSLAWTAGKVQEAAADRFPGCGHERRPGAWGHGGECLTCLSGAAVVWDDEPCGQCGHVRWMHDERGGCSDGFTGHDACECVRFDGPQP